MQIIHRSNGEAEVTVCCPHCGFFHHKIISEDYLYEWVEAYERGEIDFGTCEECKGKDTMDD